MSMDLGANAVPPFPAEYRASGMLLHVTSLPSAYGVGDVGPVAYAWANHLRDAGQTWWQALPLGPTGYGNSPYQALSSFAGNGLLISPDLLIEEGLLHEGDCPVQTLDAARVDFPTVIRRKHRLLEIAWVNFRAGKFRGRQSEYEQFCLEQSQWLNDYALFRALKAHYGGAHYLDWPTELVQRDDHALDAARQQLSCEIDRVRFAQFLLFRQGKRLKEYASAKGVRLIGDLPFFVSGDSSDVWANPQLFALDRERRPCFVSGVPPDAFSADGQLWGSPVYDWEHHRQTGYRWWIDRLRALCSHVDVVRLDHFRGFAAAWHIPAGSPTARTGSWVAGPGADLLSAVARELGGLPFIAEDLGVITPDVSALREQFDIPGTRVIQFAFDGDQTNPHLPDKYVPNTVVYTGTHDNNTSRGWFDQLSHDQKQRLRNKVARRDLGSGEAAAALMQMAWSSRAALAIAPLQDLLNLGCEARMNVPGRAEGNWAWRCSSEMLAAAPFEALAGLTRRSNRLPLAPDADDSSTPLSTALNEVTT
jgi:4-alpha-glucanotransferase